MLMAETTKGESVGFLWLALERNPGSGGGAWIYDIEILPNHRGQGFGRALLKVAEAEAVAHGVDTIGLNVFGRNSVARNLYASAGYQVSSMHLTRKLSS